MMNSVGAIGPKRQRTSSCGDLDTKTARVAFKTEFDNKRLVETQEKLIEAEKEIKTRGDLILKFQEELGHTEEKLYRKEEDFNRLKEESERLVKDHRKLADFTTLMCDTFKVNNEDDLKGFTKYYNDLIDVEAREERTNNTCKELTNKYLELTERYNQEDLKNDELVKRNEGLRGRTEQLRDEIAAMKERNAKYAGVFGTVTVAYLAYNHTETVVAGVKLGARALSSAIAAMPVENLYAMAGVALAGIILYAASSRITSGTLKVASAAVDLFVNVMTKVWEYKNVVLFMAILGTVAYCSPTASEMLAPYYTQAGEMLAALKLEAPLYYSDCIDKVTDEVTRYFA